MALAQSNINPMPNFASRPSDSSWTSWIGTFSGNAGNQPDFSATYSGSFSFTVGGDLSVIGSGSISKSYSWSGCGPPPNLATGYLAVKGYVDASNVVHFYFSVSQASNDVQIANCGTVFGATDGFDGLQVSMTLESGLPSDQVNQLPGNPDFIRITLQKTSASSSSSAVTASVPTSISAATTSAPLVVQPQTPESVDTTSLVVAGSLFGLVGAAGAALASLPVMKGGASGELGTGPTRGWSLDRGRPIGEESSTWRQAQQEREKQLEPFNDEERRAMAIWDRTSNTHIKIEKSEGPWSGTRDAARVIQDFMDRNSKVDPELAKSISEVQVYNSGGDQYFIRDFGRTYQKGWEFDTRSKTLRVYDDKTISGQWGEQYAQSYLKDIVTSIKTLKPQGLAAA